MREIGSDAFYNCRQLKRVIIAPGSRLKSIGAGCFYNTGIEMIAIPKGVEAIQSGAFYDCECLKEVIFEEGSRLTIIGDNAFCRCNKLAKINLPEGLKSIEHWTFYGCESLKNISLPDGLEKICVGCFYKSGLEMIILPASVREVCAHAFEDCKTLKSAQLNEGLKTLGARTIVNKIEYEGEVFYNTAIESIILPLTLKRIEE